MSIVEKRESFRPPSGEAPFDLSEVFFSRTDQRGIIQSGNYVFHRVAHYDWEELLGAPHKIIRHPDMPKAVFWLLWNTIQSGNPVGAYVKNRAKDGLYYWVFAVVMPYDDGYLSARIKPSSDLLKVVEQEYATLRQVENAEGITPEESANRLLGRLKDLGFPSYEEFAAQALAKEFHSRDSKLAKNTKKTSELASIVDHAEQLKSETHELIRDFAVMETVPHNLQVIASRMEPTGGPISTLSKNYGAMSRDMSDWFGTNVVGEDSNFAGIKDSAIHALFIHGMSRLLRECDDQLSFERRKLGHVDIDHERQILRGLVQSYAKGARDAVRNMSEEAGRILLACERMERHMLGLSTTRVMCKIEGARLPASGASLVDIISQLKLFQDRIDKRLEKIARLGQEIAAGL